MTFGEAIVKWVVAPILALAMLPVFMHLVAWGLVVITVSILTVGGAVALVTYLYRIARSSRSLPGGNLPPFPPTPVQRPRPPRKATRW